MQQHCFSPAHFTAKRRCLTFYNNTYNNILLSNKKKCTDFSFKLSQWAPCALRSWTNLKEMAQKTNSLCWGVQKSASILMLLITMDLADSEGDMVNLTKVVEDFQTHTGDLKEKTNLFTWLHRNMLLEKRCKINPELCLKELSSNNLKKDTHNNLLLSNKKK